MVSFCYRLFHSHKHVVDYVIEGQKRYNANGYIGGTRQRYAADSDFSHDKSS